MAEKSEDDFTISDRGSEPRTSQPAHTSPDGLTETRRVEQATSPSEIVRKAEKHHEIEATIAAIASEHIPRRHLRRALVIARNHKLLATSEFDAVRLLRKAGIDPFSNDPLVTVPTSSKDEEALANPILPARDERDPAPLVGGAVRPKKRKRRTAAPPTSLRAEVNQATEILEMRQNIARQRGKKLVHLARRMIAFVLLPSLLIGCYYHFVATKMYSVQSEFVILKAGSKSSHGSLGGLFSGTALASSTDSSATEGYLQSLEVMERLDSDIGFRQYFQSHRIDWLQRLPPDATLEAAYRVYRKYVKVQYDDRDDVIRMEVIAPDPKVAVDWSRKLISYAEEQVNQLTQALRKDQMRDAQENYDAAEMALMASQRHVIELQEKFKMISSETEVGLVIGQIRELENRIVQERLALAQMEANSTPNKARTEPIKNRVSALETQVAELRARLTKSNTGEESLAKIQGEFAIAQADLNSRQTLLVRAMQLKETAQIEANRQIRYLSLSVSPIQPDEPKYPRTIENTLVSTLILISMYLLCSMAATILREQTSH